MIKWFKRKEKKPKFHFTNPLGEMVHSCFTKEEALKLMAEVIQSPVLNYQDSKVNNMIERTYGIDIETGNYYHVYFEEGEM